ncbi:PilN family type IVB pilus formation outer membrane protein [Pseudomonas syringae pv. actinidiae]|nr:PilN family type IVB pilus formation outer membrane protein [Pseudomonas syringae pv. actinidiae]
MVNNKKLPLAAVISAVSMAALSGCSTFREAGKDYQAIDDKSKDLIKRGMALTSDDSAVSVDNSVYIGGSMFKVSDRNELPAFMSERTRFVKPDSVSFPEMISQLSDQLGKRIVLTSDATEYLNGSSDSDSGGSRSSNRADSTSFGDGDNKANPAQDPLAILNAVAYRPGGIPGQDIIFSINYDGNTRGLLDLLAFKSNLFWKWDAGEIVFFRRDTKTFTIDALPGSNEFSAKVSSARSSTDDSSGSGGTSGDNSSEHSTSLSYKPKSLYEEISNEIKTIISKDATFAVSEQTGTLTVTDTPRSLEKVQKYLDNLNGIVNKQIAIRTEVYEVTRDDSDNFAMDWNLLYNGSSKLGFDLVNSGISDSAAGSTLGMTILKPTSKFAGSKAVLNAISQKGNVSLTTSNSVYTVNGQPVPVQVADEVHYLKKVSKTEGSGDDAQPSYELEPGMVMSGFSMSILPRITSDGGIMMQFAVDISKLNSLEEIAVGDEKIQLPNRSTKNFLQRVNIKSGETLMLAGFERTESEATTSGPLSAYLWPLGGKVLGTKKKVQTVIVMTPYIMSR